MAKTSSATSAKSRDGAPTHVFVSALEVRRRTGAVAAALCRVVALLVGTLAAAVGMVRATRAEATAREEAATSRQVSDFLVRLLTLSSPDRAPGSPTTVRELLERGASTIDTDLKEQPAVQARLFGTLSTVYKIGQYPNPSALEKSLALPRELPGCRPSDRRFLFKGPHSQRLEHGTDRTSFGRRWPYASECSVRTTWMWPKS